MHLLLDNYDSFTYNLYEYFRQIGLEYNVCRADDSIWDNLEELQVSSIVLSPGPEKPENAPLCKALIDKFKDRAPILGICLGHQAIGQYFGADLYEMESPKHGKANKMQVINKSPLFEDLPLSFNVMQYHSLAIEPNKKSELEVLSRMQDQTIMAVKHLSYNIVGMQFHPESILTENGISILKNWKNFAGI